MKKRLIATTLLALIIWLCACSTDENLEDNYIGNYELTSVLLDSGEVPKSMLISVEFESFTLEKGGLCHWYIGSDWTGKEEYIYEWEATDYGVYISNDTILVYDSERDAFFEQVNEVGGIQKYIYERVD